MIPCSLHLITRSTVMRQVKGSNRFGFNKPLIPVWEVQSAHQTSFPQLMLVHAQTGSHHISRGQGRIGFLLYWPAVSMAIPVHSLSTNGWLPQMKVHIDPPWELVPALVAIVARRDRELADWYYPSWPLAFCPWQMSCTPRNRVERPSPSAQGLRLCTW